MTLAPSGRDVFRATHIGFILQMFNLLPYLSVLENVVLPMRLSRERRAPLGLTWLYCCHQCSISTCASRGV